MPLTEAQSKKYLAICNDDLCHKVVGLKASHISHKKGICEIKLKPWHLNFEKCVHGGILYFLIDVTMGFCVYPHLVPPEMILAVDVKISYLKPAMLRMKKITGVAKLVSRTRRLAVAEGEILSPSGEILCKALGTYAILKKKGS